MPERTRDAIARAIAFHTNRPTHTGGSEESAWNSNRKSTRLTIQRFPDSSTNWLKRRAAANSELLRMPDTAHFGCVRLEGRPG